MSTTPEADELAKLVLDHAEDPRIRWHADGGAHISPARLRDTGPDYGDANWEAWGDECQQRDDELAKALLDIGWEKVSDYSPWYPAEQAATLRREREWRRARDATVEAALQQIQDANTQWREAVYCNEKILCLWPQSNLASEHLIPEDIMSPRGLKVVRRYVAAVIALPAFTERYGAAEIGVDGKVDGRNKTTLAKGVGDTISINPRCRKYWFSQDRLEATRAELVELAARVDGHEREFIMNSLRIFAGAGIDLLTSALESVVLHEMAHVLSGDGDPGNAWYMEQKEFFGLGVIHQYAHGPTFVENYSFLLNLLHDGAANIFQSFLALEKLPDLAALQAQTKTLVEKLGAETFPAVC
jgi:hypothetical protein